MTRFGGVWQGNLTTWLTSSNMKKSAELKLKNVDSKLEALKDIFEAYNQRIKSQFFGYIVLAFFILNWKPTYYLLFAEVTAQTKFDFVEANTDQWSLLILPIFYGILAGLAKPWISLLGSIWAEYPVNKQKMREIKAADEVTRLKNRLIQSQNIAVESIIDAAAQDQKVNEITDEKLREEVRRQVDLIRDEFRSKETKTVSKNAQILIDKLRGTHPE